MNALKEFMMRLACRSPALPTNLDGFRVEISAKSSRADIVLDRPPRNVMSISQHEQIQAVIEALDSDPAIHVIVLRSSGEHFSSGIDNVESSHARAENASRLALALSAPSRCSKPVVAANRGYCSGSAFELSLACDFRIATETTLYALPTLSTGHILGFDSVTRLHGMIGTGRTRDVVMRSRIIDGVRAYDWGIATEFAVDNELENVTDALVRELFTCSQIGSRSIKKLLNDIEDTSFGSYVNVSISNREAISA
ncbi:enoyl-CoA hydratase/isomerase family protein [Paraburkholderia sp. C35]|uniref:enoyl-CoA hydratase/isomerase family protein n=1 Tax=Paraburkholderia sp. C35 TaxID=2126993 RepID=UPI0013A5AB33|nr:enoyl-CoA hydratase/isomerase family protein [Paraburkholderia sp. C35]